MSLEALGVLNKPGHANFCMRCLYGLPSNMSDADAGRIGVGFYCLGALDIIGLLEGKSKATDRESWREWIWEQQISRIRLKAQSSSSSAAEGRTHKDSSNVDIDGVDDVGDDDSEQRIGGFRPGPFMQTSSEESNATSIIIDSVDPDPPHLIMTYTALITLAILRDDFSRLDRRGLVALLRATQKEDGSFTAIPGQGEADIRMVYTAFVISSLLDDWRGVNIPRALDFVRKCMTYEGGFGQAPGNEAQGGPTYCALATLALAPPSFSSIAELSPLERRQVIRWLIHQQSEEEGGFSGRTEKNADACYSFWCGAALKILGVDEFVERRRHALFLDSCQFAVSGSGKGKERRLLGGIGKAGDAHPDPYHTYLALASLAIYSPVSGAHAQEVEVEGVEETGEVDASWGLPRLDALINATEETARWARAHISGNMELLEIDEDKQDEMR